MGERAVVRVTAAGEGEALSVLGHEQRLLLTGEATAGAFTLIEQVSRPGTGVPVHYHEREEETFHVASGQVRFSLDGEEITAQAGATVYLPRGARHGFQVLGEEPARLLILLSPAGAEEMFRELAALRLDPDPAEVTALCARYGNIFV